MSFSFYNNFITQKIAQNKIIRMFPKYHKKDFYRKKAKKDFYKEEEAWERAERKKN